MHLISQHFLSHLFPELNHPKYQTPLEKISFVLIVAAIVGTLTSATVLMFDKALMFVRYR